MNAQQIELYKSLKATERYILNVAAMMGEDIDYTNLRRAFKPEIRITETVVNAAIGIGIKGGLLRSSGYRRAIANPEFMIYAIPDLIDYEVEQMAIAYEFKFRFGNKSLMSLSNFLYCLLFDNKNIEDCEDLFLQLGLQFVGDRIWPLFEDKRYWSKLNVLSKSFVNAIVSKKINSTYTNLNSLSVLQEQIEVVQRYLNPGGEQSDIRCEWYEGLLARVILGFAAPYLKRINRHSIIMA